VREQGLVIIIMGSESDRSHVEQIAAELKSYEIQTEIRVASAHKTAGRLLEILAEYDSIPGPKVFITVAGRSNALSGMVDANVSEPVIACPSFSEAFAGADLFSSLRMPSGVAPLVVLDPKNAALGAAKMLGLVSAKVAEAVKTGQQAHRQVLIDADERSREAGIGDQREAIGN